MFERLNLRAENILKKYDSDFSEMEEKLRLARQLKLIRKQKLKLQETAAKWDKVHKVDSPVIKSKASSLHYQEGMLKPIETESHKMAKESTLAQEKGGPEQNRESISSDTTHQLPAIHRNMSSTNQSKAINKQLEISIQLAAKYKGQALEMEQKLQEKARSEENLRQYLQEASEKEAAAKVKLQDFMEELLERAKAAEQKAEYYQSRLSLTNSPEQGNAAATKYRVEDSSYQRYPTSTSSTPTMCRNLIQKKPPAIPTQSSSAPSTPVQSYRRPTRNRCEDNDEYVTQLLEPPSSQELPRKWKRRQDRSVDQLPGIDLSNVIDASIMWPFSNGCDVYPSPKSSGSSRSTGSTTSTPYNLWHDQIVRRRIVLFCVFAYLDTEDLITCSMLCREWRDISRHPKLWTRVELNSKSVSNKFLQTLSVWCKETCYLKLTNIKGRSKQAMESEESYHASTLGSLEDGLEMVLKACGNNLLVLTVARCDHFITKRILWLASCYNKELKCVTYRSCEPADHEVIWALGAGCPKLLSLDIAPMMPCNSAHLNNKVLQTISWCWPSLRGLSIGGRCIDKKGLLSIVVNCKHLQILELSNMNEITEDTAKELVKNGLRALQSLMLTHCPVRTRALTCLLSLSQYSLFGLRIQLSFSDYCLANDKNPGIIAGASVDKSPLFAAYNKVMQSLLRLQMKTEYEDILQVICTT